jgi:hypothetical protein
MSDYLVPVDFEARDIVNVMEGATVRDKIARLEAALNACPQETIRQIDPVHHFSPGVYMREVLLPQGTLAVGRIHRNDCLAIVVGDVSIMSEQGPMRVTGMRVFHSFPGAKRVAYAHSSTRWITVHHTNERDIEKLELELFSPTFEDLGIVELDGVEVLSGGF